MVVDVAVVVADMRAGVAVDIEPCEVLCQAPFLRRHLDGVDGNVKNVEEVDERMGIILV